jgi:hypothetical protein
VVDGDSGLFRFRVGRALWRKPEMGIQGNLRTMALPDVLQWLSNANGTGILHVRHPRKGITKRIFFNNGSILSTASSDPREYLGQFLISRGFLSEEQLNMAMETQLQTKIMLGKILIMCGILDEADLKKMLILKAEESLFDLFLWDDGDFHFEEKPAIQDDLVPISLEAMSLIMEGIRRKDEWGRIRQVIVSARAVPEKTETRLKTNALKSTSLILRTYEAVDGLRTVEEIALHLHASEFEVTLTLFRLHEKGIVAILEEKPEPEVASFLILTEKLFKEAELALAEGRFGQALNLFQYADKAKPGDPRVQRGLLKAEEGLAKAEEGFLEHFYSETVPLSSRLELAIPMQQLMKEDLSPQEGYLASRLTGDWDIESVVKVSPLPRNEALKAIHKLYDRGIVRIKPPKG